MCDLSLPDQVDPVPPEEMDHVFEDSFGAAFARIGFEAVTPRKWIRTTKVPIRELLTVYSIRHSYVACWGVSLDYVPHVSGSTIRWHRTNKSALLDLTYDPLDYTLDPNEWRVVRLFGLDYARTTAAAVARDTLRLAGEWFDSVHDLPSLIRCFEQQKAPPAVRFGFYNYVQQPLAFAFTLARANRIDEAEAELARYSELPELPGLQRSRLIHMMRDQAKWTENQHP